MAYFEGEIPVVTTGNNGGWNDWSWIIGLAVVGGIFGNGGFGFGGGYGNRGIGENYALATDFATIERKLDGVNSGICDATFALNNTITNGNFNIINSLTQGFAGLNTGLLQGNYALSSQLADCCCTTQRAIDGVKYDMSKGFCDVIRAGQDNTRQLLDYLTSEKISSLQAENAGLKAQISNDKQTATLINEIKPCPIPAYITCNPYQSAYGFGNNSCC